MSTRGSSRCYDAKYFKKAHPQQFAQDFGKDINMRIGDVKDALNTCMDDLQREFLEERASINTRIDDLQREFLEKRASINTRIDDLQREFLEERASINTHIDDLQREFLEERALTTERLAENDRKVQETYALFERSRSHATVQCAEGRGGSSSQHQSRGDRERSRSQDRETTVAPSDTDSDEPGTPIPETISEVLEAYVRDHYIGKVQKAGLTNHSTLRYRRTKSNAVLRHVRVRTAVDAFLDGFCSQTTGKFKATKKNLRDFHKKFPRELEVTKIEKTGAGRGMIRLKRKERQ
ncbi:hypothetical protein HK104_010660 [Borealophlyctis nickersoniae]|nr:hypothetical protein HK104_010660 [Borealophlyctis nickersoniae]